jgi:hypothetical protein
MTMKRVWEFRPTFNGKAAGAPSVHLTEAEAYAAQRRSHVGGPVVQATEDAAVVELMTEGLSHTQALRALAATASLAVRFTGFHGRTELVVTGFNWRAWNEGFVAADLTAAAVQAIEEADLAYCPSRRHGSLDPCTCGGLPFPTPVVSAGPGSTPVRVANGAGTYLIPIEWIDLEEAPAAIRTAAEGSRSTPAAPR